MDDFEEDPWPRFLHIDVFDRRWARLGLSDDSLGLLQLAIKDNPLDAPVMRSCGGLRKMRFVPPGEGRGKSGAYRVGYLAYPDSGRWFS